MKIDIARIAAIAAVLSFSTAIGFGSQAINLPLADRKALTLDAAKRLAAASEQVALKMKLTVVTAVVDEGGNLIYLQKMDGTQNASIEIAQRKARMAVGFKRPTKEFQDRLEKGAYGLLSIPNALPMEGGIPIIVQGQVIGAIGISGATSAEDGEIARAALAAVSK